MALWLYKCVLLKCNTWKVTSEYSQRSTLPLRFGLNDPFNPDSMS